jgi:hypothetical protein
MFAMPAASTASDNARVAAAYSGGTCELAIVSIAQARALVDRGPYAVQLQLRLEFPGHEPAVTRSLLPADYHLNNRRSPLIAAYVPGEKTNLAKKPHFGETTPVGSNVLIANLEVGRARERLERVEIELELVKITEWESLKFQIGAGVNEILKCGPFELKVWGGHRNLDVEAKAFPEFRKVHEAYLRRMPLRFLVASYAATALKAVDAGGRTPRGEGQSMTMGGPDWKQGAVSTSYHSWNSEFSPPNYGAISYPVSLTLKMPKRYETEKLKFRFAEIPLPSPK